MELRQKIEERVSEIAAIADQLPGVVIIHNIQNNFSVEYMSKLGLQHIGATMEELRQMGPDFHTRFFNPIESVEYVPKLIHGLLERNDEQEIASFFQQVKFVNSEEWMLHLSTIRILLRDDAGQPLLTITIAVTVDPMHHVTAKVNRILEENAFLRQNYQKFAQLGSREREVLKWVTLGKSSNEIAEAMFISEKTVNTHRRNIKVKLDAHTSFEFSQYARAFDLI